MRTKLLAATGVTACLLVLPFMLPSLFIRAIACPGGPIRAFMSATLLMLARC